MSDNKPIYDTRVRKIIELLKFMTRDEAAQKLGYKNYRSLDMYMRRKNFKYDSESGQYVPNENIADKLKRTQKAMHPQRLQASSLPLKRQMQTL
ncbi:hypothetical protein [Tepidanaerobacter syntrophicus]|uniref:Helix-turn-helix domain-containing protein n=1 Tax=Tepidanaerobacter syntrophicus TaxID=224999 RepID=A0A0U9HGN6_9FIRM|nr:hypothetical protein [Tepidanaerobacter syntrophicus]GAQ25686.1 hypothetical protein TSYNT_8223 [Tepidanaerobacter syntrophicus]GLI20045.1 hypothetical protein TSYNTROPHJE_18580 [Tepidanaerobacter syntrophicus]